MTDYVVDASLAFEYLLGTPLGLSVESMIEDADLSAPELLDAEVLHALRRAVLRGELDERRARMAIVDLERWDIERHPHWEFMRAAWRHRHNVSAYDAFYVAVAEELGLPILTVDGRLARAPGLGVVVQHVRMS